MRKCYLLGLQHLLWFWLFFLALVVGILEQSDCRFWCNRHWSYRSNWSSRIIGRNIFWFVSSFWFGLLLFFRSIGITRIARNISEFSLVAIGIDVAVFASNHAVGTSRFFFETTVSSFVTESKRTIVIDFIVVSDGLNWWRFCRLFGSSNRQSLREMECSCLDHHYVTKRWVGHRDRYTDLLTILKPLVDVVPLLHLEVQRRSTGCFFFIWFRYMVDANSSCFGIAQENGSA
jgi:hypothetical protein